MNKKLILPITVLFIFLTVLTISIIQYRLQRPTLLETIPLFSRPTPTPTIVTTPLPTSTTLPGVPPQTNIESATQGIDNDLSFAEKDKVIDSLPIRVENFKTTNNRTTTINIFSSDFDPLSSLRIEIYNLNFNNQELSGPDAIAFRDSFIEAKRLLAPYRLNFQNLQIIFGNRQYIQDTASYWVSAFGLRN